MPKKLENTLKKVAVKKGLSGKKADAYVYGTLNNMGMMHGSKITAKGRKMDKMEAAHPDKSRTAKANRANAYRAAVRKAYK